MALFDNAKKVAELEAQLAAKSADLEKFSAQVADLTNKNATLAAESAKQFERAEAAEKSIGELNNKFADIEKQLADEKAAHATTKASVSMTASTIAAQTLQAAGHKPIGGSDADAPVDVASKFKAMKPGPERSAFFKKHRNQLI